ncbi:MAG: phosphoenolpyruvate carboxykinase, partial [Calditrichae bacterium]|nr:phosphoenolpyruvate carboxykinase [Calditrichia bacterium]
PLFQDLAPLFKSIVNKDYSQSEYTAQFIIRIPENLSKIERIAEIYKGLMDTPEAVFEELEAQKNRLLKVQKELGDYIAPQQLN